MVLMREVLMPIAIAIIMGGPAWFGIRRLRRENTDQHSNNTSLLQNVCYRVEKIDGEVDGLQVWTATHTERHRALEKELLK
tara:strand:+ start:104 stop:346 length:243 start_codon:yes stop_codon:yes gene_type:complete